MKKHNNIFGGTVFVMVSVLLVNLAIGGWSVNEILSWFGKDISFIADTVIGLFVAEFSVPIAIVGKILITLGVF